MDTRERRAPSGWHVIRAIARREVGIAARRKLVRLLLLASAIPPLVFGIILVVRLLAEKAVGVDLGWDPVLRFLQVQVFPVTLLALGLGTPLVARDRSEDVLYLYAVRPVSPWHYAWGKILAVAVPCFVLLVAPGILIAILRQGILPDRVGTGESLALVGKVVIMAVFVAMGSAGVSVGPSAATKRARWALLMALAVYIVPDAVTEAIWRGDPYPVGPGNAVRGLLDAFFEGSQGARGILSAGLLAAYAGLGAFVTFARVRREMTP
jgi:ABC-type transport system involved in multi-copper enzyme maturation permease subunit